MQALRLRLVLCFNPVAGIHEFERWEGIKELVVFECFNPVAGIHEFERSRIAYGEIWCEVSIPLPGFMNLKELYFRLRNSRYACFNPVAGIHEFESALEQCIQKVRERFQSRCRDS